MKGIKADRNEELLSLSASDSVSTIWGAFEHAVCRAPEREFLVCADGRAYTYQEAIAQSREVARAFERLGICRGDYVALKMMNGPELVVIELALAKLGAVKVLITPALGEYEFSYQLKRSNAKVLICDSDVLLDRQLLSDALELMILATGKRYGGKGAPAIRIIDLGDVMRETGAHDSVSDEEPLKAHAESRVSADSQSVHPDDVCDVLFTSGSTGDPKGVCLTNKMVMSAAFGNCLNRGFEDGRRVFVPLPLSHVYAYVEGLLSCLIVGGTVLLSPAKLSPTEALEFIKRTRANDMLTVPSLMIKYLEVLEVEPKDFPDLHAVYCSADNCPIWVWSAIRERFRIWDVITGYGMTETSGASLQSHPSDDDEVLIQCVGTFLPDTDGTGHLVEYRVADVRTGEILPPGSEGELQCRGSSVTRGYCNDPAATSRLFTEDGWLRTGDIGQFDEQGYLRLAGRLKDSYKINGENVSTHFVEQVLGTFAGAEQVSVIGFPEENLGAVGVVFVQLEQDDPEKREQFKQYCAEKLARYQVPKYYFFLQEDQWPCSTVGKIEKTRLANSVKADEKGRLIWIAS